MADLGVVFNLIFNCNIKSNKSYSLKYVFMLFLLNMLQNDRYTDIKCLEGILCLKNKEE